MSGNEDFFIGWSAETPKVDRRFLIGLSTFLFAGAGAAAYGVAGRQDPVGPGGWDQADIREWRGIVIAEPYPMLRYRDADGAPRTALLGCLNKCAPKLMIDQYRERAVLVRGSPIIRGQYLMIATDDFGRWIEPANPQAGDEDLMFPDPEPLGSANLAGVILDTKCWFGAMRPGEGKVHKACAALCIKGGLPPGFFVKGPREQSQLLIMTDAQAGPVGPDVLPFVADPLRLNGELERRGDLVFLKTDPNTFARV